MKELELFFLQPGPLPAPQTLCSNHQVVLIIKAQVLTRLFNLGLGLERATCDPHWDRILVP